MKQHRPSRLRGEIELWRASWQQVETCLDRVEGARDEDLPYALRCLALYDAACVLERLRQRREGTFLPHPRRMSLGDENGSIGTALDDRKYELPGPLELELAVAGLVLDDDGKPEKSPPKVRLFGSEKLFDVWDAEQRRFVPLIVPRYAFGRLEYPASSTPHPWIHGLTLARVVEPELGDSDGSDDSLFSFPRREAAAEEGFASLKPWSELRAQRVAAVADDGAEELLAEGQPEFAELRQHVASGSYAQARPLVAAARASADADAATLASARATLSQTDPEDAALPALIALQDLIASERSLLASLSTRLAGGSADRDATLALIDRLPTPLTALPTAALLYAELDVTIAERVAYPDGPMRSLRVIEVGLLKMWRSRAPWFAARRPVLARLLGRFIGSFEQNLGSLLGSGQTLLADSLLGARLAVPAVAGADQLNLQLGSEPAGVRAGQIAVIGGARPTLAVILGSGKSVAGQWRLRVLPVNVSQERGVGLDGVPGLLDAGAPLGRSLASPLTGDELRRGQRAGEPEANGIPRDVLALWSRLKLLRGADFAASLPPPFSASLVVPVHATSALPLPARSSRLLLVQAPIDHGVDPPLPLLATPGEVLLLRGRDAEGVWWQGVVEVAAAQVTTLESQHVEPERDPASPLCCTPETPVVLVTLAGNTMPVELVEHVSIHRDFRGFGWPSLTTGKLLPAAIDDRTEWIRAEPFGSGYRFVAGNASAAGEAIVDRTPELEAAARLVDRWTGDV